MDKSVRCFLFESRGEEQDQENGVDVHKQPGVRCVPHMRAKVDHDFIRDQCVVTQREVAVKALGEALKKEQAGHWLVVVEASQR